MPPPAAKSGVISFLRRKTYFAPIKGIQDVSGDPFFLIRIRQTEPQVGAICKLPTNVTAVRSLTGQPLMLMRHYIQRSCPTLSESTASRKSANPWQHCHRKYWTLKLATSKTTKFAIYLARFTWLATALQRPVGQYATKQLLLKH